MPATLAQKLIARAAGVAAVAPGEIVTCRVDLAMFHDSSGPRRLAPMLDRLGARPLDPSRLVAIADHYLPADDAASREILHITRDWTRAHGVRYYEGDGICHVVLPERGHLRPGMFVVGGDSHSTTGGAFGTYMFGIGATEMVAVVVTGETWIRVPDTMMLRFDGRFAHGVCAKDVMLMLCGRFGMDGGGYQAVQYAGSAIGALPMQERMTLANMTAELGGQVGLIEPDEVTADWLRAAGVPSEQLDADALRPWRTDPDAPLGATHRFDAAQIVPMIAAPHSPALAEPVDAFAGTAVSIAYLGACTGAKLADLRMAAEVLRGRRADPAVQFVVAPASARDQQAAQADGTMAILRDAGATLLPNACGACAGYGSFRFGEEVSAISSTARNFRGRMGAASSRVYLGSPYSVAAAALTGRITDPREVLA
jgi:3-isopropylmalate/(R)-2-methylmalate dehydratase large subunit